MFPFLALKHAPHNAEDRELRDALRLSRERTGGPFVIMVLGGSEVADDRYKQSFPRCTVFTVGSHTGADVQGDWENPSVWEESKKRKPGAVIIDYGSDSWMKGSAGMHLADILKSTGAMLLFSPPPTERPDSVGGWWETMLRVHFLSDEEHMRKYNAMVLDDNQLLLCFSNSFEEAPLYPGELLQAIDECTDLMRVQETPGGLWSPNNLVAKRIEKKHSERIKDCFAKRQAMYLPVPWLTGLQLQLSLVTSCVDAPSGV
jgi:hypothetical protein